MPTPLSKIRDYPKFLNDHWALHLAPRAKDAPTVISTFAGCGGSSLGYSFAGFNELLAVEWDDNAVETFKLNFPGVPVYHGDIAELSVEKVLEMTGLKVGELDVFDGSPPCQGFSTAGKRVMQDARNFLFREYSRLLKGLQPKVFVMENVSGMVKGKMKLIFAEILRDLKSCGYKVKAVLMNVMYFGVPQSRQRMIFIGVREHLDIVPSHPNPATMESGIGDVIPGVRATRSMKINPWIRHPRAAATVTKTNSDYQFLAAGGIRKPCNDEVAMLTGFPLGFQFDSNGWGQIGNSVPPLFMKAIAEHIRQNILTTAQYQHNGG